MKLIVVPLTQDALERVDTNSSVDGDLSELPLSDLHFDELWAIGIFAKLNLVLNIMIDDFEDEIISNGQLPQAKEIVLEAIKEHQYITPLLALLKQIELAMQKETAVLFFF